MDYPVLFYGVNLGRIPENRRNLPLEVMSEDWQDLNIEKLEKFVEKRGLNAFFTEETFESVNYDEVHIGIEIRNDYVYGQKIEGRERVGDECIRFDREEIAELTKNPSQLIENLKHMGLEVHSKDFALYGFTGID